MISTRIRTPDENIVLESTPSKRDLVYIKVHDLGGALTTISQTTN